MFNTFNILIIGYFGGFFIGWIIRLHSETVKTEKLFKENAFLCRKQEILSNHIAELNNSLKRKDNILTRALEIIHKYQEVISLLEKTKEYYRVENADLRAQLAAYQRDEIKAGAIRQSTDESGEYGTTGEDI